MDIYDFYYLEIKKKGLTMHYLAEKIGCNRSYLNLLIQGKAKPSFILAKKIEEVTAGKVTVIEVFQYYCDMCDKKNQMAS
jgi:transcriptional regulator with XRE-family HTH domain